MAKVIKLSAPPKKWLVQKQRALPCLNRVVSEQTYHDARDFASAFKKMRLTVKNLVLDFCLKKESIGEKAEQQSIRDYQSTLVKEILQLTVAMRRSLAHEAAALETLAHKIAANIISGDISEHYHNLINMEAELARAFSLRLVVPKPYVDFITSSFQPLLKILGSSAFLASHNHDRGAQIWVSTADTSFALDFDEADIESIFTGVIEWVPRK